MIRVGTFNGRSIIADRVQDIGIVAENIRNAALDIIGLQQITRVNNNPLHQRLEQYDCLQFYRPKPADSPGMAIYFKKDRFTLLGSENCEQFNRVSIIADLLDTTTQRVYRVVVTHLFHGKEPIEELLEKVNQRNVAPAHLTMILAECWPNELTPAEEAGFSVIGKPDCPYTRILYKSIAPNTIVTLEELPNQVNASEVKILGAQINLNLPEPASVNIETPAFSQVEEPKEWSFWCFLNPCNWISWIFNCFSS